MSIDHHNRYESTIANVTLTTKEAPKKIEDLLPELIQEILSRLPIHSLLQSKFVCPTWYTLINSHRLSKMHYVHSSQNLNPTNLIIFSSGKKNVYYIPDFDKCEKAIRLKNLPSYFAYYFGRLVGSLHGLICVKYRSVEPGTFTFIICNPVIGDWIKLPEPLHFLDGFDMCSGFGYDSDNNVYKVIRMRAGSVMIEVGFLMVEILTVGSSSWRSIGTILWNIHSGKASGVFVDGHLHWLIGDHNGIGIGIRAFNVKEERFGVVSLPDSITNNSTRVMYHELGVLGEHLMLVDSSHEDVLQVWTMKHHGIKESWILEFIIPKPANCRILKPLGLMKNGNILLLYDGTTFSSYNPQNRTHFVLRVLGLPWRWAYRWHIELAVPHVGTIASLEDVIVMEDQEWSSSNLESVYDLTTGHH